MSIKSFFGYDKINKHIVFYAIGAALSGIALGLAINYYFVVNIFVAAILLLLGVLFAHYHYNKIS